MTPPNPRRRGQAVVEYLLLLAIIVGIIGGIVRVAAYNWFNNQVTTMREPLVNRLRQAPGYLGIPVPWFFAGRDMNEVNQNFQRSDDNPPGGGGGGSSDPSNPNSSADPSANVGANDPNGGDKQGGPGGDLDGPNGGAAGGGPRGDAGRPKAIGDTRSGSAGQNRPPDNRRRTEEDDDTKRSDSRSGKKPSELDGGYGAGTDSNLEDENGDGKIDEKDAEIAQQNEEAGLTPEMKARRRVLEQSERRGGGGCRQLSSFELIRIAIFIMLGFIAFIIFFASRGKRGD